MPSGKFHFAAGAVSSALVLHYTDQSLTYMLAGALSAMLPDSDLRNTKAGCLLPMWIFCNHRGFTHSIAALVMITFLASFINVPCAIAVGTGYLSHILLDYLTPRGVKLAWPKKKHYSLRR